MRPPQLVHRWLTVPGVALGVVALTLGVPGPAGASELPVPPGYTVTSREAPAEGVEHVVLTRDNPKLVVNVARVIPGAPAALRAVLSNDTVAGDAPRLETTSSMCERVHCILGVNADFAGVGTDQPLGGFVTDGELLRSPSPTQHQLSLTADGELTDETFSWTGRLVTSDLNQLAFDGLNVAREPGRIVLYTPAFGPTTQTRIPGVDLVLRVVEPAGELRFGGSARVELEALNQGVQNAPIPPGGAVLSGEGAGAEALAAVWDQVGRGITSNQALVGVKSLDVDVRESVGGSPVLVKDGRRWFTDPGDNFTTGRHPRTLVGWTPGGDTLLVTVDGRQPGISVGMSLYEATDLLIALGATEGINLDGGGSTTFVRGGDVVNQVSDVQVRRGGRSVVRHSRQGGDQLLGHVERPVASALVVVPRIAVPVPLVDPSAGVALGLREQALALPVGASASPWVSAVAVPGARSGPGVAGVGTGVAGDLPPAPGGRPLRRSGSGLRPPFIALAVVADLVALAALVAVVLSARYRLRRG